MSAEVVIREARTLIGVPWRHQGRKPWALDCAGLVILSFANAGWPRALEAPYKYGRDGWGNLVRESLNKYFGDPLLYGELWQPGDVPLYAMGGHELHIGIFGDHPVGGLTLIHSSRRSGCVVEGALRTFSNIDVVDGFRPAWQT